MSAPIIGITTRNFKGIVLDIPWILAPRSYSEAVIKAGAIPLLIPLNLPKDHIKELLLRIDGIIFSGGGDISPDLFGGQAHDKVYGVDAERDEHEIWLMKKAITEEVPFLCICRGLQIFNVCYGGTLFTHILDQKEGALDHSHKKENPFNFRAHDVHLVKDSRIRDIIGRSDIEVNSLHHQGIEFASAELDISAVSSDNLVEGLELQSHPFGIAVQWHPEWMPDDEDQQKLFTALADAAQKRIKYNGK